MVLSLDYGTKQIGLALGDKSQKLALPYGQIENKGLKFVLEEVKNICQKERISKIVIGLPISLSGKKEKSAEKVFEFIEELKQVVKIPIVTEDERLSTKMAQKLLRGSGMKKVDHSIAAMLILQSYLDKSKGQNLNVKLMSNAQC
jgi:putative Holliday junction resolvase